MRTKNSQIATREETDHVLGTTSYRVVPDDELHGDHSDRMVHPHFHCRGTARQVLDQTCSKRSMAIRRQARVVLPRPRRRARQVPAPRGHFVFYNNHSILKTFSEIKVMEEIFLNLHDW